MFSSFTRRSRNLHLASKHGTTGMQRVHITRSLKRPAVLAIVVPLMTFIIIRTSDLWLPDNLKPALDSSESSLARWKQDDGLKAAAKQTHLLLPFPVWFRRKHSVRYWIDDPEWQEYEKLQNDQTRLKALYRIVARETITTVIADKRMKDYILRELKCGPHLDISFDVRIPSRPKDVYEIPAIAISANQITPIWQTLPERYGDKLHRILHPVVFLEATRAGLNVFWKATWTRLQQNIGWLDTAKPHPTKPGTSGQSKSQPPGITNQPPLSTSGSKTAISDAQAKFGWDMETLQQRHRAIIGEPTDRNPTRQAMAAFKKTFAHQQIKALSQLPRGACLIEGFVRFNGEYGNLRVYVYMIYRPGEDSLMGEPIIEKMRVYLNAPKLREAGHIRLEEMKRMKAEPKTKELPAQSAGRLSPESDKEDDKK